MGLQLGRHELVRVQEQDGEKCALFSAAECA